MSALQSTVGECEGHLQAIEASFEHWLDIAQELSQVATESEQDTINESHENQQNLQSQELRRTYAERETQRREDAVKEAQRRMTLAEEAFKQASKNIPSGNALLRNPLCSSSLTNRFQLGMLWAWP